MTPAQYEYVLAARERGETYAKIALALGMSAGTLSKQVNRGRPMRIRQPQAVDAYIIENIGREGYRKMAEAMGCNESSVRRRVRVLAREGLIERPGHHTEKVSRNLPHVDPAEEHAKDAAHLRLCADSLGGGFPRLSERPAKNGEPIACLPVIWPVMEAA